SDNLRTQHRRQFGLPARVRTRANQRVGIDEAGVRILDDDVTIRSGRLFPLHHFELVCAAECVGYYSLHVIFSFVSQICGCVRYLRTLFMNFCVRGSLGLPSTSPGGPCSTMNPSSMNTT